MRYIKKFNESSQEDEEYTKEEFEKPQMLFDYLISIGFEKIILKDTIKSSDLIVFRHNEFYRDELLSLPSYPLNHDDYEKAKKFLDIWGYLDDEDLRDFQEKFMK